MWGNLEVDCNYDDFINVFCTEEKMLNLDPVYFDTMDNYLNEVMYFNAQIEKIQAYYKKKDSQLIVMIESKFPPIFKMFKESRKS